jgi:chromosome segregation ATPase
VSRRLINQESLNMTLRKDIDKITSKYEEIMSKNTELEAQVTSQLDTIQGLETRLHEVTIANTTVNTQLSTANTNVISLNKLCNDTMQENSRLQNEVEEVKSKYHKLGTHCHSPTYSLT